jgi:phage protein D
MSVAYQPITQGQDFYVPAFEVHIQGRPIQRDIIRDILQVTYKDSLEDIDSFTLDVNNWDDTTRTFAYSDSSLFDPGKEIELWMGYRGKDGLRKMLSGEITTLTPTFPASGAPKLTVGGVNLLHKLRTKQESHTYAKKTDSQIATEIGKRLGIPVDIAPVDEDQRDYLLQDNKYDIVFLMGLAREDGYDIYVVEDSTQKPTRLYFGPTIGGRRPAYKLKYGATLIEFSPSLTTANQVSEVTVRGWDPKAKKAITYTAKRSEIRNKGVGAKGGQQNLEASFQQKREIVTHPPVQTQAEAKRRAIQALETNAGDMIKGTGSTVGLPDLRAGSLLQIDGLGTRFSGHYRVTDTTHTSGDAGYTTQFGCRREETDG